MKVKEESEKVGLKPNIQKTKIMASSPISSVQFSHSVMSDSSLPHESQHARPPCPLATLGVYSNSCPSSWWCHPAISSSVVPFSSCPQSFPASESFPMRQLLAWGGQSIGVSALASVLPMNTQDWSPLEWTGWISLESKGLSRVFSNTTVQKHQFFTAQHFSQSNSHIWSHHFMAHRWGNSGNSGWLYFGGSKITADGDCSHKIKRRLLFGRKVMTNLDSILKSRDITLPTKVCLVKAMVFPVVIYGCESWTI